MSTLPPEDDRTMMPPAARDEANGEPENGHNALPPGARVGEFEIIRVVGAGGFGIVYLARDHTLEREVALKEYMPSSLAARTRLFQVTVKSSRYTDTFQAGMRSFINEARLLARFDHPSLVKVYRFWEANNTAYMAMPYYKGHTLKQALQQMAAPLDEVSLKRLLAPLLDALEMLHAQQCFHRDIAPDNILILVSGRPLLLDFGAARRAIGGMAQHFTVILKPGYAPIEQYAECSSMQQGPWTDIYALASVVHFAITGSAPAPSVARMVSDQQVPLARRAEGRYSSAFLETIDLCLAVRPEQRPQSVAALRSLLQLDAGKDSDDAATRVPPLPSPQQEAAVHGAAGPLKAGLGKSAAIAAGVAALALAVGIPVFLARDRAPSPTPPVLSLPPAPPEPRPAAKPLQPAELLTKVFNARNPEHQVSVRLEKSQVQIGRDRLRFSITSSKSGYVYLMLVGTDSSQFWLLFPNSIDSNNRITAARPMDLPRNTWHMDASGPPGTNRFVAMVSEMPRDFSAAGLTPEGPFFAFPQQPAQATAAGAGARPVIAGEAVCPTGTQAHCPDSYGAAMFLIEELPAR